MSGIRHSSLAVIQDLTLKNATDSLYNINVIVEKNIALLDSHRGAFSFCVAKVDQHQRLASAAPPSGQVDNPCA